MKVILSLILSLSILSCTDNGEKEIIIVPKDFKGYILIIFDQKNGVTPKYEGNKRVYEIPANGILKTQFGTNEGWREFTEYYYEKISLENKLPSFVEFNKIPNDMVVGFMGSTGSVKKSSNGEDRIKFAEYFIGTKKQINEATKDSEKLNIVKLVSEAPAKR